MVSLIEQGTGTRILICSTPNMRYEYAIDFIIDVPPELEEYHVPASLFSAYCGKFHPARHFHEGKQDRQHCYHRLEGRDDIVFQVTDDGWGNDEDTLSQIFPQRQKERRQQYRYLYTHCMQLLWRVALWFATAAVPAAERWSK